MKLKYNFEIVEMGEQKVAVPVGLDAENLHGVLKLNKQGYEIFKYLQEGKSKEEIVSAINVKYEDDRQTIEQYIDEFIQELINIEIVE